ncbi:plasmid mobilization relaxosome protein MobC [Mucilaginibacter sp. PAMB04168]|uniref:plasmid mobilization protein n=1 Tax=Mucilaginibacter sp. PAMB04168 TaxID=3138567 RepID=UPI0031F67657
MARPALQEEQRRQVQVNIRLTLEENLKVITYAEASGLTPANWIRQKVFTGRFPPLKQSPIEAALYRELHRIGVNLNQAVRQVNSHQLAAIPEPVLTELLTIQREIIKRLLS